MKCIHPMQKARTKAYMGMYEGGGFGFGFGAGRVFGADSSLCSVLCLSVCVRGRSDRGLSVQVR